MRFEIDVNKCLQRYVDRANADVAQLLRRFENIIAYTADEKHDRVSAAVGAYQMEVETAALVRIDHTSFLATLVFPYRIFNYPIYLVFWRIYASV